MLWHSLTRVSIGAGAACSRLAGWARCLLWVGRWEGLDGSVSTCRALPVRPSCFCPHNRTTTGQSNGREMLPSGWTSRPEAWLVRKRGAASEAFRSSVDARGRSLGRLPLSGSRGIQTCSLLVDTHKQERQQRSGEAPTCQRRDVSGASGLLGSLEGLGGARASAAAGTRPKNWRRSLLVTRCKVAPPTCRGRAPGPRAFRAAWQQAPPSTRVGT